MTIETTAIVTTQQGDGANTVWTYSFLIPAAADMIVSLTDRTTGIVTVLSSALYTATGLNNSNGGTVTYPLTGSPLTTNSNITIERSLAYTQDTDLVNQGGYYPDVVEAALDYITMLTQQLSNLGDRALVTPVTDPAVPLALPSVYERADQMLGFDSDGNPVASQPSSASVSSAMQPVVNAATLALARTAMGLGVLAVEGIGAGLQDDGASALRVNNTITAVTTNQSVVASFHQKQYTSTGPLNFTLARANTLWNGFGFWVHAYTSTVTLVPNAADTIDGNITGASVVIPVNYAAWVSTNGAASGLWRVRLMQIPILNQTSQGPLFQCRLVKSGANLALGRVDGCSLFINGSNQLIPATAPTLTPPAVASTVYYIYAYVTGGVVTLEYSTTVYATDATYGHKIKSGDATRTLVGLARTTAGNAWADSYAQRFIRSYYNDLGITGSNSFTANRTTTSATYVEINSEIRCEFLIWTGEITLFFSAGAATGQANNQLVTTAISIDGTPVNAYTSSTVAGVGGSVSVNINLVSGPDSSSANLGEGYHYVTLVGKTDGSLIGTWLGNATVAGHVILSLFSRL